MDFLGCISDYIGQTEIRILENHSPFFRLKCQIPFLFYERQNHNEWSVCGLSLPDTISSSEEIEKY